ncbi:MAG: sugar ABC transporter permease [Chloroflexota bacterium]|nr:MAG: sugar ABC transporter permease [Chloroflexota bacterium]
MAEATRVVARTDLLYRLGLRRLAAREAALGYTIVGVVYLFFAAFIFGPLLLAVYISTTKWDALSPLSEARFIGLDNYIDLFSDDRFRLSMIHDFEFAVKAYFGQIGLGLGLALIISNIRRFQALARFISFAPFVLPLVATAIVFFILMNPVWGSFNAGLRLAGLPPSQWLSSPESAMNSTALMIIWKYAGYYMVLFLTALMSVPQEYYDAAHIDGAGPLQSFRYITWPLIRPAFLFISIINVIGNLQVFTPIFIMTGGGPNRATEVVVLLMYNTAFNNFRYSLANAMAVILFLVILALTVLQMKVLRKGGMET